jgi:hypothetical protein
MKFGEVRRFCKPKWFFNADNDNLPEFVDLRLDRPDILPDLLDDELHDLLMQKLRVREQEIQKQMRGQNRRFMGESKLRRQHWNRSPRAPEDRFKTSPRVASSSKWVRLAQLQRDRDWERLYAQARADYAVGLDPEFPAGTYWMRIYAHVKVANAPP